MNKIIALVTFIFVASSFAAEGKHAIAIGAGGFGWAGLSEKQTSKTSSSFDTTNGASSLSLNYAHYFSSGFIVGGY